MKALLNRKLTEAQRKDVFGMAESMVESYGGSLLDYQKKALKEKLNEAGLISLKPSYSYRDTMYQTFSDRNDNYKKTGYFN